MFAIIEGVDITEKEAKTIMGEIIRDIRNLPHSFDNDYGMKMYTTIACADYGLLKFKFHKKQIIITEMLSNLLHRISEIVIRNSITKKYRSEIRSPNITRDVVFDIMTTCKVENHSIKDMKLKHPELRQTEVMRIMNGEYKYILSDDDIAYYDSLKPIEDPKINKINIIEIRKKRRQGVTLQILADTFELTVNKIYDIVKTKKYDYLFDEANFEEESYILESLLNKVEDSYYEKHPDELLIEPNVEMILECESSVSEKGSETIFLPKKTEGSIINISTKEELEKHFILDKNPLLETKDMLMDDVIKKKDEAVMNFLNTINQGGNKEMYENLTATKEELELFKPSAGKKRLKVLENKHIDIVKRLLRETNNDVAWLSGFLGLGVSTIKRILYGHSSVGRGNNPVKKRKEKIAAEQQKLFNNQKEIKQEDKKLKLNNLPERVKNRHHLQKGIPVDIVITKDTKKVSILELLQLDPMKYTLIPRISILGFIDCDVDGQNGFWAIFETARIPEINWESQGIFAHDFGNNSRIAGTIDFKTGIMTIQESMNISGLRLLVELVKIETESDTTEKETQDEGIKSLKETVDKHISEQLDGEKPASVLTPIDNGEILKELGIYQTGDENNDVVINKVLEEKIETQLNIKIIKTEKNTTVTINTANLEFGKEISINIII